jgi:hypothetical protein
MNSATNICASGGNQNGSRRNTDLNKISVLSFLLTSMQLTPSIYDDLAATEFHIFLLGFHLEFFHTDLFTPQLHTDTINDYDFNTSVVFHFQKFSN